MYRRLEQFLERRIPVWAVGMLLLGALGFATVLAWAVRQHLLATHSRIGSLGYVVEFIAALPALPRDVYAELFGRSPLLVPDRFPDQPNGLTYFGDRKDKGYLLLSIYDRTAGQSVVKLIRLEDGREIHRWQPDLAEIRGLSSFNGRFSDRNNQWAKRYRIIHPFLQDDGTIVFLAPLTSISNCSRINWILDDAAYHHSIERDHEGNYWVPSVIEPGMFHQFGTHRSRFRDDALTKITPSGRVLFRKSVAEILLENGYRDILWAAGSYEDDATHLNDIEPAHTDSAHWKKGDVLVSIRNRSSVFLYRPSTNKILWLQTGPWVNQHDADFVGQSSISVFGNNVLRTPSGNDFITPSNEVYLVDLKKGQTVSPFSNFLQKQNVRTKTEGLSHVLEDGTVFVEESNHGRLLKGSDRGLQWSYIERVENGYLGMTGWSRYLPAEYVNPILPKLKCE